jgi:hypothetical protein
MNLTELDSEEVIALMTALDVLLGAYSLENEEMFKAKYRNHKLKAKKAFGLYEKLEQRLHKQLL